MTAVIVRAKRSTFCSSNVMHTGCGGLVMRSTRLATARTRRLDCRMPMPARYLECVWGGGCV